MTPCDSIKSNLCPGTDCDKCLRIDSSDNICSVIPQGIPFSPWDLRNNKRNYLWCTETKHESSVDGFTKQLTRAHQ